MSKLVLASLLAVAGTGVVILIGRGSRIAGALGGSSRLPIRVSKSKLGFDVCAIDADGAKVGCVHTARMDETSSDSPYGVGYSWLDEKLQKQGLATSLYERAASEACSRGGSLESDFLLTDNRRRFWEKQVRKGRAEKLTRKSGKETVTFYRLSCPAPGDLSSAKHSLYAMPDRWWTGKPPREEKLCYKRKTDAMLMFLDWNQNVVEEYGGATAKGSHGEFDAMTKHGALPTDIAEAVWVSLPAPARGRKFCLEDIDVDALNDTSPGRSHDVGFQLPDYVVEAKLLEQEYEHYRDLDPMDDVPF